GMRMSGRVVHPDGRPAAGATVTARSSDFPVDDVFPPPRQPNESWREPKGDQAASSAVDGSGHFELRDLAPGNYHLLAFIAFSNQGEQEVVRQTASSVPTDGREVLITLPRPAPTPGGTLTVNVMERGTRRPLLRCDVKVAKDSIHRRAVTAVRPGG